MTGFCTIARATQLPHARVLADGLSRHHPGSRLRVLIIGSRPTRAEAEPFELVELPLDDLEWLRYAERWADLELLLRPRLVLTLLDELASPVVYLNPAMDVLRPLEPVEAVLGRGHVALTARVQGELPADGVPPTEDDLRRAGRMSGALLAAPPAHSAVEFLRWWGNQMAGTINDLPPRAVSTHDDVHSGAELNRWLDLAPSTSGEIEVLEDPGCVGSYWNLHAFDFASPPRAMHFEGFDPERPYVLSAFGDRVLVSDHPLLAELCPSYAERLVARGWGDLRRRDMVGFDLPSGMTFDDRLSYLHEDALIDGVELGDVFTPEGDERFKEWLKSPAPRGGQAGITRYVARVYRERVDVVAAYPDLEGADAEGLAGWAWVYGRDEMGIPREFLPPLPAGIDVDEGEQQEALPISVNVSGYFGRTLGLGQAARAYVAALEAAGVPVSTTTVDPDLPVEKSSSRGGDGYGLLEHTDIVHPHDARFNIVCVNADELPRFADQVGEEFFRDRFSIGVWAWETDHVPDRWKGAFGLLDEIWVYSRYVAENLARSAPQPVVPIPPTVSAPDPQGATVDLVPDDGFLFLFMFDFFSTVQRKNPVGLVRAFMKAFEPGEGPRLLVKTIHGRYRMAALEELRWATRGRPDIHIVDLSLPPAERDALLASCDCYVSLHRSEGFGLPLAECMALGKPAIATGFSGNTDFMTVGNSYLVDYGMTHVGAEVEIYPAEGTWAEPDLDHAAALMRHVWEHPDEARARGERARREIEQNYSPAAVGALVEDRLRKIDESLSRRAAPRAQVPEPRSRLKRYSSLSAAKNGLASRWRVATARRGRRTSSGK